MIGKFGGENGENGENGGEAPVELWIDLCTFGRIASDLH
ncbi:MAG: hypothetical protein RLZZ214_4048 [Verrucomicrobiota bacterium]